MHNHKSTKHAAVVTAALAMVVCSDGGTSSNAGTAAPDVGTSTTPVENVAFFLGDGMGTTTMTVACAYKVDGDGELTMDALPETGFVRTFSNSTQVTDPAPSMSAYMTGVKMNNEIILMSPDTAVYDAGSKDYLSGTDSIYPSDNGKPVTALLELMETAGYGTGVVTITRIMHTTSAVTYSHICHRDDESTIIAQLTPTGKDFNAALGGSVDVVFGGGRKYFQPTTIGDARTDGRDLIAELKTGSYHYISNKAEFNTLQAAGDKVVGLFTSSHMSYGPDRDSSGEPNLGGMTSRVIDVFAAKKKDFFLMVEDGRIGHVLHETTARKALQDTVTFDSAIRGTVDRLNTIGPGLKNTLIVVTADHDHTLALDGYIKHTGPISDSNLGVLGLFGSYVMGANTTGTGSDPSTIIGFGTGGNRPATRGVLTDVVAYDRDYHQEAVIPVIPGGETHGGTDVFIDAHSLGAERSTGTADNTEVFGLIKQVMDLQERESTS